MAETQWRIMTIASACDVTALSFCSHTFLFALWARLWFETPPLRYRLSKVMMSDDGRCSWSGIGKKEGEKNLQQRSSDAENCPGALQGADLALTPDQNSLPRYYLASINTGRGHTEVPTMFDYWRNDGNFSKLFVLPAHEKSPVVTCSTARCCRWTRDSNVEKHWDFCRRAGADKAPVSTSRLCDGRIVGFVYQRVCLFGLNVWYWKVSGGHSSGFHHLPWLCPAESQFVTLVCLVGTLLVPSSPRTGCSGCVTH